MEQLTKQYQLTINGVSTQGAQANLIVDSAEKTKSVEAGEGIVVNASPRLLQKAEPLQ